MRHDTRILWTCLACTAALLLGPTKGEARHSSIGGEPVDGALTVTVIRADTESWIPIPGAFVMVGLQPGVPFSANHGRTGTDGSVTFVSDALIGPLTVTAGAEGFQYVSFVDVDADELTLALSPREAYDPSQTPGSDRVEVSGTVTGFEVNNGLLGDGWLDAGIVLPLLNIEDALAFDLSKLLSGSREVDLGGVIGRILIPENLVLPRQMEFLTWIERPAYAWLSPDGVFTRMGCMAGRLATSVLTDWITGGGTKVDLIAAMVPYKVGLSPELQVNGPTMQDFALTHGLSPNVTVEYANTPSYHSMILFTGGELPDAPGQDSIVPLGFRMIQQSGGAGSASVTSASSEGDLAGVDSLYGGVAVSLNASGDPVLNHGMLAVLDRSGTVTPPGTVFLDSYYQVIDELFLPREPGHGLFTFTDAYRPGATPSPLPDLTVSRVALEVSVPCDPARPDCFEGDRDRLDLDQWTVVTPGDAFAFETPELPDSAPPFLSRPPDDPAGDVRYKLVWDLSVYGLTRGEPFDFDRYDFATFPDRATHVSRRRETLPLAGLTPDTPDNVSPVFGEADVPLPVALESSDFSDPDPEDTHAASRWQVTEAAGQYESPVWETVTGPGALTHAGIPLGTLEPGRTYFWRVRHRDDRGMWSAYSEETSFSPAGCQQDADCNDGVLCNGTETCDPELGCLPGTAPSCDDGISCTVDRCDPETDTCRNEPWDQACDNGAWCDGQETCDPAAGCLAGDPPACRDGVSCTADTCDEAIDSCVYTPLDVRCDDGLYCNGAETCDPETGCRDGTPPSCDDGIPCTEDACNEATDACEALPSDALCDNGVWCDGQETCSPLSGCEPGIPPDCSDGNPCTDDVCDADLDDCRNACGATDALDACCADAACIDEEVCSLDCTDEDRDGYAVEGLSCGPADCDDTDPDIHPAAPEICDGRDNQCEGDDGFGEVDEGCGLTLLSPDNGASLTEPPVFTWAGRHDFFRLYLVLPIRNLGYQVIPVGWMPSTELSMESIPGLWDALSPGQWALWVVVGVDLRDGADPEVEVSETRAFVRSASRG